MEQYNKLNSVMETGNHFKNGASPKKLMRILLLLCIASMPIILNAQTVNVTYAIRFKRDPDMELDNKLLSAYRYETINKDDKLKIRQTVTVLYLGPAFHGTIDNTGI